MELFDKFYNTNQFATTNVTGGNTMGKRLVEGYYNCLSQDEDFLQYFTLNFDNSTNQNYYTTTFVCKKRDWLNLIIQLRGGYFDTYYQASTYITYNSTTLNSKTYRWDYSDTSTFLQYSFINFKNLLDNGLYIQLFAKQKPTATRIVLTYVKTLNDNTIKPCILTFTESNIYMTTTSGTKNQILPVTNSISSNSCYKGENIGLNSSTITVYPLQLGDLVFPLLYFYDGGIILPEGTEIGIGNKKYIVISPNNNILLKLREKEEE